MNSIALRIAKIMKEKEISFRDLEKATGIPRPTLQRYANGTTVNINMNRLKVIADALNTPISYFLGAAHSDLSGYNDIEVEMAFRELAEKEPDTIAYDPGDEIDLGLVALDIRKIIIDNFGTSCSIELAEQLADIVANVVFDGSFSEFLTLYPKAKPAIQKAALAVLKAGSE